MQEKLRLTDDDHFREAYLLPALAKKWIAMTIPDKPQSSKQRYQLTPKGKKRAQKGGGTKGT